METGTVKKAELLFKVNCPEVIFRKEDPVLILKDDPELNEIEVDAEKDELTPEILMFPLVDCKFKFPPAIISKESPGTTNLIP